MPNDTTTGAATSRARQLRPAVRRPTLARLAISGPSGAGKTWTALSVAEVLAPGGRIAVVDTERGDDQQGAAELYADQFAFQVLEWQPPYDPRELALTLDELGRLPEGRPDVVVIDSASHFWRGEGGTLDIAGGRFGGWKAATPAQDQLVHAILAARFHVIVCTRARMDYAVEDGADGKQKVTKLGLAPVQREDLEYEFQVVLTIDQDHRIDVSKTRAQPLAGGSWAAGQQGRLAATYAAWLRSGVALAPQADVDALRAALRMADLGKDWQAAGWPKADQLDRDRLPDAWTWLAVQLAIEEHVFEPRAEDPEQCKACDCSWRATWHVLADNTEPEPEAGTPHPDAADPQPEPIAPTDAPAPEPTADEMAKEEQPEPDTDHDQVAEPAEPDRTVGTESGNTEPEDARAAAQRHVAETLA